MTCCDQLSSYDTFALMSFFTDKQHILFKSANESATSFLGFSMVAEKFGSIGVQKHSCTFAAPKTISVVEFKRKILRKQEVSFRELFAKGGQRDDLPVVKRSSSFPANRDDNKRNGKVH